MKPSQQSYGQPPGLFGPALLMLLLFALVPLALAAAAYGGQAKPDLLSGPRPGPCADQLASADYAGGTDAYGNPVAPAGGTDAAPPVQIPGETVLTKVHGTEVPVEVRGLNKGLAAQNACQPLKPAAKASHPRS